MAPGSRSEARSITTCPAVAGSRFGHCRRPPRSCPTRQPRPQPLRLTPCRRQRRRRPGSVCHPGVVKKKFFSLLALLLSGAPVTISGQLLRLPPPNPLDCGTPFGNAHSHRGSGFGHWHRYQAVFSRMAPSGSQTKMTLDAILRGESLPSAARRRAPCVAQFSPQRNFNFSVRGAIACRTGRKTMADRRKGRWVDQLFRGRRCEYGRKASLAAGCRTIGRAPCQPAE